MYATQVLVIKKLSPEDSMYLHCLYPKLNNPHLINNLTHDCDLNKDNKLYTSYMNQFFYSHMKGERLMICEGLLNYFETSSEELLEQGAQRAQKIYQDQIEKLISENKQLASTLEERTKLLVQNNIAY